MRRHGSKKNKLELSWSYSDLCRALDVGTSPNARSLLTESRMFQITCMQSLVQNEYVIYVRHRPAKVNDWHVHWLRLNEINANAIRFATKSIRANEIANIIINFVLPKCVFLLRARRTPSITGNCILNSASWCVDRSRFQMRYEKMNEFGFIYGNIALFRIWGITFVVLYYCGAGNGSHIPALSFQRRIRREKKREHFSHRWLHVMRVNGTNPWPSNIIPHRNPLKYFPFFSLQHLCRHVLRNQHKLMRFLQQQIRLCSSGSARPLQKFSEDGEPVKLIQIPPSAYDTKSTPITHESDNGILFKVCAPNQEGSQRYTNLHPFLLLLEIGFRFTCSTRRTSSTTTETGSRYPCIWKTLHRSHAENILAQKSGRLAEAGNYANGKLSHSSRRQSASLRRRGMHPMRLRLHCICLSFVVFFICWV